jgi:thiamine pyrophosphate-dependent acetolactate synthase large subunit-like protein
MSKQPKMKRRQFLAGALAAGPAVGLAAATTKVSAQTQAPARAASVPAVPPNENVLPDGTPLTETRSGSDFMVDVIKMLGIDYIASLPASTFRGLQESLLNYGMNTKPEFILCLHEECAVAMAHGYAKVARKPMAAMVHSTVGLQHASMAMYNAYADRAPILVISGNMQNNAARRPNVEWNHAALDQNATVRDFTKWDAQPTSLQATGEALVQAYDLATTAPMGPVLVTIDTDVQEDPLHKEEEEKLRIPKLTRRAHPQGDDESLREAAKLLVAAENPVIYANRYGRTEKGPALLMQLAELLHAPVIDGRARMNFPSRHKYNHSGRREQALAQADVLLALEPVELWGLTNDVQDLIGRPNRRLNRQANLKIIHIGTESLLLKANYGDVQRYAPADLPIAGDAEASLPSLIEAVKRELTPARAATLAQRGEKLAAMTPRLLEQARVDATYGWDASPISVARTCMELWDHLKSEDWTMPTETVFLSDYPHRLWNIDKPHYWIGGSGAQGVGYNAPAALGAALANKGTGRVTAAIIGDGELMMTNTMLWTAAHHQIPLLAIVHNNRAYHMEVMHTLRMADRRSRDTSRIHIGTDMRNPNIDFATLAKSMGVYGQGPIENPNDLGPAIKRAIDVVKRGEPALIDVVSQPR